MHDEAEQSPVPEWDPLSQPVIDDQRAAYDHLRGRCPVAYSDLLGWSVLRHADVLTVLHDHDTFRNNVSQHMSVPNGMDPPEHTSYRRLIEPYFGPEPMERFGPACDRIAADLVASLPRAGPIEVMDAFAHEFAVRVQCAFMGWPDDLHGPLRAWVDEQHRATGAKDRDALTRERQPVRRCGASRAGHPTTGGWRRLERPDDSAAGRIGGRPGSDRRRDRQHRAQLDRRRTRHDCREHRHHRDVPRRPFIRPGAATR